MPTVADFLDTNVVVYAFDRSDPAKQERAQAPMADHPDAMISAQVLLESAALGGCPTLWTQDLTDGSVIRDVAIRNPFR